MKRGSFAEQPRWYQVGSVVFEVCGFVDPTQVLDLRAVSRVFATVIDTQLSSSMWGDIAESSNSHSATVTPLLRAIVPMYGKLRVFSKNSMSNTYAVQHLVVTDMVGRRLIWLAHAPTAAVSPSLVWQLVVAALTRNSKEGSLHIPCLKDVAHPDFTEAIISLAPHDARLTINGKAVRADCKTPLSDMTWRAIDTAPQGLPPGADVWVVIRGFDAVGDVTFTADSVAASATERAVFEKRARSLAEAVDKPLDFEAACAAL